jgi:hypothetical protein
MTSARQRARNLYADALAAQGPAWGNAAASVRAGYDNSWILAGLTAVEALLRLVADDDDEEAPEVQRA